MMDVMFDIPSDASVVKCIVTKEAALGEGQPELVYGEPNARLKASRATAKSGTRKARPDATA